jgi:hypothetical protein
MYRSKGPPMVPTRSGSDRLLAHLAQLSPETTAFLVREIELHRHLGDDDPSYRHILEVVRHLAKVREYSFGHLSTPLRLFCDPFEDLLTDERMGARASSRVARTSIAPIWTWLTGPQGPEALRGLVVALSRAAERDDRTAARTMQPRMIELVAGEIETALARCADSRKLTAQLVAILGGPDAARDARTVAAAFRSFDAIRALRAAIPARIADLDSAGGNISGALRAFERSAPGAAGLGFATLVSRMVFPAQALRLPVRALSSNVAARIAESGFAPLVRILLDELELAALGVDRLVRERAAPADVLGALDRYHGLARGIGGELDTGPRDVVGQSLAAGRRTASAALDAELRRLPDRISALFKPYLDSRSSKSLPGPGAGAVDEVLRVLTLGRDCRQFMDELSLNEAVMRCDEAAPARLTLITDTVITDLRNTSGARQSSLKAWLEVAVSLTAIAMGDTDADLVARLAEVASESRSPRPVDAANAG